MTKLNLQRAKEIRKLHAKGNRSIQELAHTFHVHRRSITKVLQHQIYAENRVLEPFDVPTQDDDRWIVVKHSATSNEAFRIARLLYHPDKGGTSHQFRLVSELIAKYVIDPSQFTADRQEYSQIPMLQVKAQVINGLFVKLMSLKLELRRNRRQKLQDINALRACIAQTRRKLEKFNVSGVLTPDMLSLRHSKFVVNPIENSCLRLDINMLS